MRVMYLILRVLGVFVLSLLYSINYEFSKITLIQVLYVLCFLLSLSALPMYYRKRNCIIELRRKTGFSIHTIKIILVVIYVMFAVIFDVFKLDVFNDEVLYIRPFYFYGAMIVIIWDIFFVKNNKEDKIQV